jgi:hypothetical protein
MWTTVFLVLVYTAIIYTPVLPFVIPCDEYFEPAACYGHLTGKLMPYGVILYVVLGLEYLVYVGSHHLIYGMWHAE